MSTGPSDQGKKRLHEVAQRHVGDEQVPGLVALVARGDDVHAEVLGTMAVGGPPVSRDSIFRIASDSKPITAAATLWARTSARTSRGASAWLCRMTDPTAGPAASAPRG